MSDYMFEPFTSIVDLHVRPVELDIDKPTTFFNYRSQGQTQKIWFYSFITCATQMYWENTKRSNML